MQDLFEKIRISLSEIYPDREVSSLLRLTIEHVTETPLPLFLSDKSKQISASQKLKIEEIVGRLKTFEPIQYILGETEFFGLPFYTDKNVLIPRPETEELVELVISENKNGVKHILDIGTGSGCIAIALKKYMPKAVLEAWDFSLDALHTAKKNQDRNNVSVLLKEVNILKEYPTSNSFDIIVSNPPYVLNSEKTSMNRNVLEFEPHSALFVPDDNPLLFYIRIADIAKILLKNEGKLYFEINQEKGVETVDMLQAKGFCNVMLSKDISGNDRIVKADYHKQQ